MEVARAYQPYQPILKDPLKTNLLLSFRTPESESSAATLTSPLPSPSLRVTGAPGVPHRPLVRLSLLGTLNRRSRRITTAAPRSYIR